MASILSRPQCVNVTSRPEQNGTFCIHFQIRFVVLKLFYPISNSSWYFIKGLYHYPRPEWVVWCLQWVHRAHNYWHRWVCLTRRIHAYPRPPFWNVILRLNKSKGRHFEDILNACSRDNIFVFWSGLLILIIIIITCSRKHSYYRPLTCNSRQSVVSDVSKRTSTRGSHGGTTWGACLHHRGPRSAASPTERKQKIRGYEDTNNVVGFKHFIYVLSYYHLPVERYGTNSSSRESELIFICGKGIPRFNQKPHIWSYMFYHSKRLAIHCQCTGVTTGLHTKLPLFCGTYAWRSETLPYRHLNLWWLSHLLRQANDPDSPFARIELHNDAILCQNWHIISNLSDVSPFTDLELYGVVFAETGVFHDSRSDRAFLDVEESSRTLLNKHDQHA